MLAEWLRERDREKAQAARKEEERLRKARAARSAREAKWDQAAETAALAVQRAESAARAAAQAVKLTENAAQAAIQAGKRAETADEERQQWREWYQSQQAALQAGIPFNEPPPFLTPNDTGNDR